MDAIKGGNKGSSLDTNVPGERKWRGKKRSLTMVNGKSSQEEISQNREPVNPPPPRPNQEARHGFMPSPSLLMLAGRCGFSFPPQMLRSIFKPNQPSSAWASAPPTRSASLFVCLSIRLAHCSTEQNSKRMAKTRMFLFVYRGDFFSKSVFLSCTRADRPRAAPTRLCDLAPLSPAS